MTNTPFLPANDAAERIVRHFQSEGFAGISEGLVVRIRLKQGTREEVETAFGEAAGQNAPPPVQRYFEIRPLGFFSDKRSYAEARSAIQADFTTGLRQGLPRVFFDAAPVVIDDVLANSTKYDVLMKLRDNADEYAIAILLNDPDFAFLDYLGTHHGNDWQQIMGKFETTAASIGDELF